jgi:ribosomal protein S6--L-glutamate ligase
LIKKLGGLPLVAKLLQGSQGVGVSILETPLSANTVLESFAKLKADVKLQTFIKANGKDIRAIVIGDSVSVAMERTANKGDFRANISKNGSGRKVELSEDDKQICIRAARSIGLGFAGIDIMKDEEGRTYVIEANGNSGSKIIGITGHNYFDDLVFNAEKIALKTSPDTTANSKDTKQSNTPSASHSTLGITTNIDDLRIKYPQAMKGF